MDGRRAPRQPRTHPTPPHSRPTCPSSDSPAPALTPPPATVSRHRPILQCDLWFHVDKLSSAHVYLRLGKGQTIDDITPEASSGFYARAPQWYSGLRACRSGSSNLRLGRLRPAQSRSPVISCE